MKILVACDLSASALSDLRSLGCEVRIEQSIDEVRPEQVADVNVLVVAKARVGTEAIAAGGRLQLIVHAGIGSGAISLTEASDRGVFVADCPHQDAAAISELALGLLLALDRQVVEATLSLRSGRWQRNEFKSALGLAGRTLGLVGWGTAALGLAQRAAGLGMQVCAWGPTLGPDEARSRGVEYCDWPREVARMAPFVVVLPFADATGEQVIDTEFLQTLPDGACLVHLGDPACIDESALIDTVQRRGLRLALDSHASAPASEGGKFRSRLMSLPGVIGTPSIRSSTLQARDATAATVVDVIRTFLLTGSAPYALNLAERTPARWQLVLRVLDQVGVMAAILEAIRADGINAEEISSYVFAGAKAASCTISLRERPTPETLETIRMLPFVLYLDLRAVV